MQASNIPAKFQIPFGNSAASGTIRAIPVASQSGITPGAASLTDGFPITNFEQPSAGGVFPFGQDFNGILNQITAWTRWMNAGGPVAYDATFQGEIGGYPVGAIVESATTLGTLWLCTADNNTTNPDTGGAGWISLAAAISSYAVASGATNAWTATLAVPPAALYDGFMVRVEFGATNTLASPTFNLNEFGAKTVYSSDGATALAIGQLPKNAILQWGATVGGWICLNVSTTAASITANAPLSGNGTSGNPLQWTNPGYIMNVVTQSPITGNGTSGSPIGFNNPGYLTAVYVSSPMTGNGTSGNPLAANCLPLTGGTLSGNLEITTTNPNFTFNKAAGGDYSQIWAQTNGILNWSLDLSGSVNQFAVDRYNSGGAYVDSPISISWSTGIVSFSQALSAPGANLTGGLAATGATLTGPLSVTANITASQSAADIQYTLSRQNGYTARIAGQTNGSNRWQIIPGTAENESGSNFGSNFAIVRYNDAGVFVDDPLVINRATGVVGFTEQPTWGGVGLITSVVVDGSSVHGNGTAASPLSAQVFADGSTILGAGTSGSPLVANQAGKVFAAYYGGANPTIGSGSANSGYHVTSWNISALSQGAYTLFHVVFTNSAPSDYVVVFGAYGNVSGDGGAAGSVAQAAVVGSGNEWGYPSPTANDFYLYAGDPYGETPCPPFIVVLN